MIFDLCKLICTKDKHQANMFDVLVYHAVSGQEQQSPLAGIQLSHHPRHRVSKAAHKKESTSLDMDALSDASAAASLLTVLLEHDLLESQKAQLTPAVR